MKKIAFILLLLNIAVLAAWQLSPPANNVDLSADNASKNQTNQAQVNGRTQALPKLMLIGETASSGITPSESEGGSVGAKAATGQMSDLTDEEMQLEPTDLAVGDEAVKSNSNGTGNNANAPPSGNAGIERPPLVPQPIAAPLASQTLPARNSVPKEPRTDEPELDEPKTELSVQAETQVQPQSINANKPSPQPVSSPVSRPAPTRPAQQSSAESSTGSSTKPASGAQHCYAIGPMLKREQVLKIGTELDSPQRELRVRKSQTEQAGSYMVMLPKQANEAAAEALLAKLQQAGVKDVAILRKPANRFAISLGVFVSIDTARKRWREISDKGFVPILRPIQQTIAAEWLDIKLAATDRPPWINQAELQGVPVAKRSCAAIR